MLLKQAPKPPEPSPTEILAAIEKPRAIIRAEERLALLREIRDSLSTMAEAVRDNRQGMPISPLHLEVIEHQRENAQQLADARKALAKATADHEAQLRGSLADPRAAATDRMRRAWDDLLDAWAELDGLDEALRKASGSSGIAKRRTSAKQAELIFARPVKDRLAGG
jgi:hypothetical protein